MSAKHGLTRSFGLIGCLMAVALLGSALFASVASAKKPPLTPTAYVALGDSLSFGYKRATLDANQVANKANCEASATAAAKGEIELARAEGALCEPASSFEPGFVGYFGKKLAKTEKEAGNALTTVNLGCPGETSDGLIGHNELFGGGAGAEYDPCGYQNIDQYQLKAPIGASSELEAAYSLIASKSAGEVKAVSLQIGSNDELAVVAKCESAYSPEHGFKSLGECIEHEAGEEGYAYEGGLFKHILTNIGETIGVLRSAGYHGVVLVLGFYNPDATLLPGSDKLDAILNESLEYEIGSGAYGAGVKIAQPFPLINPEAALYTEGETAKETEKKTQLEEAAICKYTEMCEGGKFPSSSGDIHPTKSGYTKIGKLMVEAF
jgi:lysophospholipase L1-like esterase